MRKFLKDQYSRNRGGKSAMLEIACAHCGEVICFYQKDGPGMLKRMYCDRIIGPEELASKINDCDFKQLEPLVCESCKRVLATPMIYEKEKRLALRLYVGAVKSKKISLKEVEEKI